MQRPPDVLDAGTLTLRQLRPDDAADMAAAVTASLAHLRPWMAWATEENATLEAQHQRCAEAERQRDEGTAFLYTLRVDHLLVGTLGMHVRPTCVEIGYWVHISHVDNGYATAAARAATSAALALPWVPAVEIHCDAANVASAAVPRKLGYLMTGVEPRTPRAQAETGIDQIWRTARPAY